MNKINKMNKRNYNDVQKCEFLLKLNDNIVCQRYFTVKEFNSVAANSLELHEMIGYIASDLIDDLKYKTLILLDSSFVDKDIHKLDLSKNEEYFTITIKKGAQEIYTRIVPGHIYPPKVRFTVDIRPRLTQILRDLTDMLSSKKVTTYYQDYSLNV